MTRNPRAPKDERQEKLEQLLQQLDIAAGALHESIHWVNQIDFNRQEDLRALTEALMAIYAHRDVVFEERPDLAPPKPDRIWSDVNRPHERKDVLDRLFDQLRFADQILRDATARVTALGLHSGSGKYTMASTLERTAAMTREVGMELDVLAKTNAMPGAAKRVEPQDRSETLALLDQDLTLASHVLDNCAGLFRDLDLDPVNVRTIADCLASISDVHWQIYQERPDLVPDLLRDVFERQQRQRSDSA